jgi:hypothetical protein
MPSDSGAQGVNYEENVEAAVQQIFYNAGVNNIVFTTQPVANATTIYFTSPLSRPVGTNIVGWTLGLIDQFNENADDQVIIFPQDNAATDAITIAHELGHTFGLQHTDNGSIMDGNESEIINPTFSNVVELTGTGETSNALYHLDRYVNGEPDALLQANKIFPGRYDLPSGDLGLQKTSISPLTAGVPESTVLYDIKIFAMEGIGLESGDDSNDEMTTLGSYDQITLAQLAQLSFFVPADASLEIVGSSTEGGVLDLVLASGDPLDPDDLLLEAGSDPSDIYLDQVSDDGTSYSTLANFTLTSSPAPEPGILGSLFVFLIPTLGRRRAENI